MAKLKILFVSSEVRPYAMCGGLGDVSGSLPVYLADRGHDIRVLMPGYGTISELQSFKKHEKPLGIPTGYGEFWSQLVEDRLQKSNVPVYFINHLGLFGRNGLYGDDNGEFGDNLMRFTVLSKGAIQLCHYLGWYPDLIHCNDWQTALIPAFLNTNDFARKTAKIATLLTIHNLGYQGYFPADSWNATGLPWHLFNHLGYEYNNSLNLLKGGIYHSTLINTVSTTYSHEIQTPERGEGLDGVLRDRGASLYGILNGIDEKAWDPATDKYLDYHFSKNSLEGKGKCKTALQKKLGLEQRSDRPLVAIISRLAYQKGLDVVASVIKRLLEFDLQFVLVGTGDSQLENYYRSLNKFYPGKFKAIIDFNTPLAHQIEAGADLFLMPSRYEPCGLNQIYSLRYGTLPIVRATGGLADTVSNYDEATETGTGFKFWDLSGHAILGVTKWALDIYKYKPASFQKMQIRAMEQNTGWQKAASEYEELYNKAIWQRTSSVHL
ncbi:MAG: glycogen synthase GlgA [Deltaproteobacteria bacterium]|jgi:starch synthase|nr:glycogen synthase GlgA [Deltaproteobacteria bacterium]